jgi:hypothetical protein
MPTSLLKLAPTTLVLLLLVVQSQAGEKSQTSATSGALARELSVQRGTLAQAVDYAKRLKADPLSQVQSSPPGRYIDAYSKTWDTLPKYDVSYFDDLAAVINEEPVQQKDLLMMGMLSVERTSGRHSFRSIWARAAFI